jgi:hypothetical protein
MMHVFEVIAGNKLKVFQMLILTFNAVATITASAGPASDGCVFAKNKLGSSI